MVVQWYHKRLQQENGDGTMKEMVLKVEGDITGNGDDFEMVMVVVRTCMVLV